MIIEDHIKCKFVTKQMSGSLLSHRHFNVPSSELNAIEVRKEGHVQSKAIGRPKFFARTWPSSCLRNHITELELKCFVDFKVAWPVLERRGPRKNQNCKIKPSSCRFGKHDS